MIGFLSLRLKGKSVSNRCSCVLPAPYDGPPSPSIGTELDTWRLRVRRGSPDPAALGDHIRRVSRYSATVSRTNFTRGLLGVSATLTWTAM